MTKRHGKTHGQGQKHGQGERDEEREAEHLFGGEVEVVRERKEGQDCERETSLSARTKPFGLGLHSPRGASLSLSPPLLSASTADERAAAIDYAERERERK